MSVHLGFASELSSDRLFSLKRQFLPLGKIGGVPSWLNPVDLPSTEQLSCAVCGKPLAFLLQIYCTSLNSPPHAFHRYLFVFLCRNPDCSQTNDASNFVVLRCQLPRYNAYYSAESALDPAVVGDVSDPYYNEIYFAKLCRLCGCRATKRCGKCVQQWYCSKEHQTLDWTEGGHKLYCGSTPPNTLNTLGANTEASISNPFLFKEFGIEMDLEEFDESMEQDQIAADDDSDADESDDNSTREELIRRLDELKRFENTNISAKDLEGIEERAKDSLYNVFYRTISTNPKQILRYAKGGAPLLATDYSPRPLISTELLNETNGVEHRPVPNCELCGAPRQFEMQLMPHLLSLMDVDRLGKSIDWATLIIFTCSQDCAIPNNGYAREFAYKQDFADDEGGDQAKTK